MSIPVSIDPLGTLGLPSGWRRLAAVTFAPDTYLLTPLRFYELMKVTCILDASNVVKTDDASLLVFGTEGSVMQERYSAPIIYARITREADHAVYYSAKGNIPIVAERAPAFEGKMTITSYGDGEKQHTTVNGVSYESVFPYVAERLGQSTYLGGNPRTGGCALSWVFNSCIVHALDGAILANFIPVTNGQTAAIYDVVSRDFCSLVNGNLTP